MEVGGRDIYLQQLQDFLFFISTLYTAYHKQTSSSRRIDLVGTFPAVLDWYLPAHGEYAANRSTSVGTSKYAPDSRSHKSQSTRSPKHLRHLSLSSVLSFNLSIPFNRF